MFFKIGVLKNLQNLQENTPTGVSFLIKAQASILPIIEKETLVLMFSCEFCNIFRNKFFIEDLRTTVSVRVFL